MTFVRAKTTSPKKRSAKDKGKSKRHATAAPRRRRADADDPSSRPAATRPARPCERARSSPGVALALRSLRSCCPLRWRPPAPMPGAGEAPAWRLEQVLPPQRPGDRPKARQALPVGLGQNRRHRVLGAQPRAADHRRRPAHGPAGRVGLQRRRMARARRRMRRHRRAHRLGRARTNSGPSPTGARDRPANPAANSNAAAAGRQHALPLRRRRRSSPPTRTRPSRPTPTRRCTPRAASSSADCWFAGDPLEEPQLGAFQLHWNGSALEAEPYPGEGHAIESMSLLEGALYESVRIAPSDRVSDAATPNRRCSIASTRRALSRCSNRKRPKCRCTTRRRAPRSAGLLHLSSADGALWGGGRAQAGTATAARAGAGDGRAPRRGRLEPARSAREHPLGPLFPTCRKQRCWRTRTNLGGDVASDAAVSAIAAEPGGEGAWLALAPPEGRGALTDARGARAHLRAQGRCAKRRRCPPSAEQEEGDRPQGRRRRSSSARRRTTAGWRPRRAGCSTSRPQANAACPQRDPGESGASSGLITYRPPDQGLPQVLADAPPPDTSGPGRRTARLRRHVRRSERPADRIEGAGAAALATCTAGWCTARRSNCASTSRSRRACACSPSATSRSSRARRCARSRPATASCCCA